MNMGNYLELSWFHVAWSALLILLNGAISLLLQLRIEKLLVLASLRTICQLLLMGLILQWIFQVERWYLILGWGLLMTLIAAWTAWNRNERTFPGMWWNVLTSIWSSSWIIMAIALFTVFHQLEKWYQPQYAIPILGMILGNTLNGISLGLNTFTETILQRRAKIELILALGGTRWEAAKESVQHAIRIGMIPIVNSMMIVGLVSLPGMMTGQLLAGADPLQAVKYQIVIMFLIASATALGTLGVVLFCYRSLFNENHQFQYHLLKQKA